ncbi:MAG TPA: FG-GAP-like repeat-containing protein [Thermoanaerobaculia bacterium]|nr:FG-GAP-like repeat-containing protein [Thermoanaerobaculia bacterium]
MLKAIVLTLSLGAAAAFAQAPAPPPEVRAANEKIAATDFDGAIAILEDFTAKNPQRGGVVQLLARTYVQKGDVDGALRTYERLTSYPGQRGPALVEIAALHHGRKDEAKTLAALKRVRDTGSVDFEQLRTDPRFESLQKDARFLALLPKPADFEKPFVEKTRIIHELRGDAKSGQFGWIARRIGDVDGDKVADFTTSAPTYPVDGTPGGRVYVYSGRSGKLLWQHTGKKDEQLGIGIEAAGDTNRDGIPDVIAGGPGSGYVYIFSGRDGKLLRTLGEGNTNGGFGRTSTAGDMNGDEHSDVFIGAPGDAEGAGRAFVFSGKDGAVLLTLTGEKAGNAFGSTLAGGLAGKERVLMVGAPGAGPRGTGRVYVYKGLTAKPAFTMDSDETGGAFGAMFMSVVGDVNADKVQDLYVSDWANNANGRGTGRAYVYSGTDGKLLSTLTGEAPGDGFGIGVADAGDVDRDGTADLIVGAWQHASGAESGGRVYLYSGRTQKLLQTITCRTPGDTFGFDTTNLGDVDGDGAIDFLVTSAWSGVNGFQSGRVFVIAGEPQTTKGKS